MSLCVICETRIATSFQVGFKTIRSDVCRTCNSKLQNYCQSDQIMKVQELKDKILEDIKKTERWEGKNEELEIAGQGAIAGYKTALKYIDKVFGK